MSKTMKRWMILALLAVVSVGLKAQEVKVVYSDFTGGTVEATAFDGQKVVITVTPSEGYYIAKDDIEVIAVKDPSSATRGDESPVLALALELTLVDAEGKAITDEKGGAVSDPEDLTATRCYAFTVPEGLGAWVRVADFHETVNTHLVLDETVTELNAEQLSANPNLKTITIQNAEQVVSVGKCDVSGLTIDVPGNLYNEYLSAEGWDKAQEITCTTGVEMTGVAFGDNNNYDTFVSSEAVRVPSVLNAFVINEIDAKGVVLEEIKDGIIPAGVAVLLLSKQEKGSDFRTAPVASSDKKGAAYDNLLQAAGEGGQPVNLGEVYLLYNDVFYLSQAGTIPEGGVYLPVPVKKDDQGNEQPGKTRAFLTINGDDGTTAIDPTRLSALSSHLAEGWYDLNGRRLPAKPTAKGLYIFGGRLIMIK